MATLQNIGKLKYRGKDGQWHDLPVVVQDADGSVSTISGKGAPTSATQGKVNQLYRDEDTQKLYICTATDGGYTWAAVSGGSVDVDDTLTKAGYAADAKAAGDAIGRKIDAPQTAQVGEVLTVEEVDTDGKPTKWKTAPTAAEQVQPDWNQNDETAADYVKNRPFYSKIEKKAFALNAGEHVTFNGVVFHGGDIVNITIDGQDTSLVANDVIVDDALPYSYIGDTFEDLRGGTGDYGWTYMCAEEFPGSSSIISSIISLESHTFECDVNVVYRLPLKYSPVTIKSYGETESGAYIFNPEVIDEVLYDNSLYQSDIYKIRGIISNNSGHTQLKIVGEYRKYKLESYMIVYFKRYKITNNTVNIEDRFVIPKNEITDENFRRLIVNSSKSSGTLIYLSSIVIGDIDYEPILSLTGECLSGTFLTVDGYLYSVIVKFNSSSSATRFDQDWTLIVKRIL